VVICTITGPVAVGIIVRRQQQMQRREVVGIGL